MQNHVLAVFTIVMTNYKQHKTTVNLLYAQAQVHHDLPTRKMQVPAFNNIHSYPETLQSISRLREIQSKKGHRHMIT